jgi:hypothetical protein
MASFEGTAFDRITSEISRLRAISSLVEISVLYIFFEMTRKLTVNSTSPCQSAHQSGWWIQTSLPSCRDAGRGVGAGVVLLEAVSSILCGLFGWVVVL